MEFVADNETDNEIMKTHKNTLLAAHNQRISSIKKKKQTLGEIDDILNLELVRGNFRSKK